MNAYLQISTPEGSFSHYFYVQIRNNILSLSQQNGLFKSRSYQIPLADIEALVIDEHFGAERISFYYEDTHFVVSSCGLGVIEYLHTNLCQKVSGAIWLTSGTSLS